MGKPARTACGVNLPGDEHGRVEEQRLSRRLVQLDSLGLEVAAVWRRKPDLAPAREHDLAFLPGLGVDDKREPTPTMPTEERFQSAVMIRVPMRNDERAQFFDRNL
jgi:hypothetical protein